MNNHKNIFTKQQLDQRIKLPDNNNNENNN